MLLSFIVPKPSYISLKTSCKHTLHHFLIGFDVFEQKLVNYPLGRIAGRLMVEFLQMEKLWLIPVLKVAFGFNILKMSYKAVSTKTNKFPFCLPEHIFH